MASLIDAMLSPRFPHRRINATDGGIDVKKTQAREGGSEMGVARLLILAIVCVLSPGISTAQQVKLKAALQVPVSELFIGQSLAQFKTEIERRTRNAISIGIFDDGKPYNDAQIMNEKSWPRWLRPTGLRSWRSPRVCSPKFGKKRLEQSSQPMPLRVRRDEDRRVAAAPGRGMARLQLRSRSWLYGPDRRSRRAADGGLWSAADGAVLLRGPGERDARPAIRGPPPLARSLCC